MWTSLDPGAPVKPIGGTPHAKPLSPPPSTSRFQETVHSMGLQNLHLHHPMLRQKPHQSRSPHKAACRISLRCTFLVGIRLWKMSCSATYVVGDHLICPPSPAAANKANLTHWMTYRIPHPLLLQGGTGSNGVEGFERARMYWTDPTPTA